MDLLIQQCVREALAGIASVEDEITITSLPSDIQERELVENFMLTGCGCNEVDSKPCS